MSATLIVFGLFFLFAYAFNGSSGLPVIDYSFLSSAALLIIAGIFNIDKQGRNFSGYIILLGLVSYLPMVWQRFIWEFGPDWPGFILDLVIIFTLLNFCLIKFGYPNIMMLGKHRNGET